MYHKMCEMLVIVDARTEAQCTQIPKKDRLGHRVVVPTLSHTETRRIVIIEGDRLLPVILTIDEVEDDLETDYYAIVDSVTKLKDLTNEELTTIAHHINDRGIKQLVYQFLLKFKDALSPKELRRNATHRWWMRRWDTPEMPILNLEMDEEGFVMVDLWHTRRGNLGPTSFKPPGR